MTKRPSIQTDSPPAKRQELPSSCPSDPPPSLDYDSLKKVIEKIRPEVLPDLPQIKHESLWWRMHFALEEVHWPNNLLPIKEFKENLEQEQARFLEAARRGIAEDASQNDMEHVVFHSECFYDGWGELPLIVPQRCFGQNLTPLLVSSSTGVL
jgi:hypothetical protein